MALFAQALANMILVRDNPQKMAASVPIAQGASAKTVAPVALILAAILKHLIPWELVTCIGWKLGSTTCTVTWFLTLGTDSKPGRPNNRSEIQVAANRPHYPALSVPSVLLYDHSAFRNF